MYVKKQYKHILMYFAKSVKVSQSSYKALRIPKVLKVVIKGLLKQNGSAVHLVNNLYPLHLTDQCPNERFLSTFTSLHHLSFACPLVVK